MSFPNNLPNNYQCWLVNEISQEIIDTFDTNSIVELQRYAESNIEYFVYEGPETVYGHRVHSKIEGHPIWNYETKQFELVWL